jgi:2-polyprenyl-3-methyl-5-hydroxy-6-metoxy-1,4-benzoquinol methylase
LYTTELERSVPPSAELSRQARDLYQQTGVIEVKLLSLRPLICPMDAVIGHIPTGSRVLDIGCGAGLMLLLAARAGRLDERDGLESVGFDADARTIDTARSAAARARLAGRVRFEHRRAQDAWPEGAFDVVSLIDVLHHVPRDAQRAVVDAAAARVPPGGRLIYKDMDGSGPRGWANTVHDLLKAGDWAKYVPARQIEAWASAAGLTLLHATDQNRLWYRHQLRVFARPV